MKSLYKYLFGVLCGFGCAFYLFHVKQEGCLRFYIKTTMSYTHTASLSVLHVSRETIQAFDDNLRAVSPVSQKRFSRVIIVSRET